MLDRFTVPGMADLASIRRLWAIGGTLAGLYIANEILAWVGGTGASAKFDWGFYYVTLRAWLLPLLSVCYLGGLCFTIARSKSRRLRLALAPAILIPIAIITLCWSFIKTLVTD